MAKGSVVSRCEMSIPAKPRSQCRWIIRAIPGFVFSMCVAAASIVPARAQSASPSAASGSNSSPASSPITSQVTDSRGLPISAARVLNASGKLFGITDASGHLAVNCSRPCDVTVEATGFASRKVLWGSGVSIALDVASNRESVSVTAYRAPLGDLESPVSTRVLSSTDLREAAPVTFDGQLRLVPGVETFRRSSSLAANPSSQGLSLRGLGSTSASRTLVTQDDIPLNDAFGGWIHWEELPELSIHSVELVRGGASDLYGSSAIGGVINVLQQRPSNNQIELKSSFASLNTYQDSLLFESHRGHWGALATGGVLGTDGFIQLTPAARGAITTPSNVHAQNGLLLLDHTQGRLRLFLRGSALNEARNNGTQVQTNATRLWRFSTGSDWNAADGSSLVFRAYGSAEHYRQSFSSTFAGPCYTTKLTSPQNFECLNRLARTPDDEMGAVMHWSKPLAPGLLFVVGADTHDVRAGDFETVIPKSQIPNYINLNDRQRQTGAYAELLWTHQAWTVSTSGRYDWFSNFDGQRWLPTFSILPHVAERVFDPRLGVSRKLGQHFALSASGFRAYRAPTPNELYRSTQVGNLLTYPNNDLLSERATGWETGVAMEQRWGTVHASYFWTRVNRPITALTINDQSSPIQLMRENLGQIESRGISADLQLQPKRWMTLETGYQYANATVTQGTGTAPAGNWIPQVAHNMATAQLRAYRPSLGTLSLQGKISGHQFDDDANTNLLHGYFRLDAYASHQFGRRMEVFTSGENLLNRQIEVGRTPTLTLGAPRSGRIGFRLKLTPDAK